jgi:sulfite reductase (ferredoxin)
MKFYTVSPVLDKELEQFEKDIADFKSGALDPIKFKAFRVAHGIYEQRQLDTYMVRIRCAAGGITPAQLAHASKLAEEYGSGEVHFTTRQEIQLHDVLIDGIMPVIRGLLEVDLSTRGGGGNTIRNILTPPDSGVNPDDVFDVDPYAIALTTRMINEEDSWNLPRKVKINFSTNADDVTYTQATCLGFVATEKDGQKGFEVYTAGGMGAKPMVGHQLLPFVPENQVYQVTRAIKVMFDKHGNRRSKYSSRIKFLWKKLDKDEYLRLFHEEFDVIKDDRSLDLELPEIENKAADSISLEPVTLDTPEFEQWKKRYVVDQKQEGLISIKLPLQLGDLIREDGKVLTEFLLHFGDNCIRCDRAQNIRLRNIPSEYVGNAYQVISGLTRTLVKHASFIGDMINCTGAQTCKLGICLPRGLSGAIRDRLDTSDLDLDAIPNFRLNMSGCPNTCGMHHIADLGFFGKVGRNDGNMYPAYNVLAGAETGAGKTKYAQRYGEVAAHHIPSFVYDFLKVYIDRKKESSDINYKVFLENEGIALIERLCDTYKEVPALEEDDTYYTDFGAKNRLSLDEIGTAECSAGLFDMLDLDKKMIKKIRKARAASGSATEDDVYQQLFHASRMLLVTRGLDSKTDEQAFNLFSKHFITTNLVAESFQPLVDLGIKQDKTALLTKLEDVDSLADSVLTLYENMDDSLRFKSPTGDVIVEEAVSDDNSDVIEKDYRGVACPMNFVKTKLVLETLNSGDRLQILLDDGAPIQNVPNSVVLEGHKVLSKTSTDGYWTVVIQKS